MVGFTSANQSLMNRTCSISLLLLNAGCVGYNEMPVDFGVIEFSESSTHNTCDSNLQLMSDQEHFVSMDVPLEFSVQVQNPRDDQWIEWRDDSGNIIADTPLLKDGSAVLNFSPGQEYPDTVYASLEDPSGDCIDTVEQVKQHVTVCKGVLDNLGSSDDWMFVGDAYWSDFGWVELNHNMQASQGAVFNPMVHIPNGSISIRFTIQTGNGLHSGADGLALTIIDVEDPSRLKDLIQSAPPGGGLGYGVGAPDGSWNGEALTVEIDTWANIEEYEAYDPTEENHIAITRNADPSNHEVWSSIPNVEDFQPHDVQVDITAESLRVMYDGEEVVYQQNPTPFMGGYVFLSGSTGWATNYHRVSDLEILHSCL